MIIDCLKIRDEILEELNLLENNGVVAFIQVGDRADSNSYLKSKKTMCDKKGIKYIHIKKEESITQEELIDIIKFHNSSVDTKGIMVQLPLPKHIDENAIINVINPAKDIDGFTYINKGKVISGDESGVIPCTPLGIIKILDKINFDYKGKNVVVVGRSNIVGKPMVQLLINRGCTVTCCNSNTPDTTLKNLILNSDLFISAIDKAWYFDIEYFGKDNLDKLNNITAIDVGIIRVDNKIMGNIDVELYDNFKAITPVPKGVGPMTVASVLLNIAKCNN